RFAFRKSFPRISEIRIERQRRFESEYGALVLIEHRQVLAAIGEHSRIRRQNLCVCNIVLLKTHCAISQSPHSEMRLRRLMKALVTGEIKNQALRHKLIALRDPLDQVAVQLVGHQQLIRYISWRDLDFISDHCLNHFQECNANSSSKLLVPIKTCGIVFPLL